MTYIGQRVDIPCLGMATVVGLFRFNSNLVRVKLDSDDADRETNVDRRRWEKNG